MSENIEARFNEIFSKATAEQTTPLKKAILLVLGQSGADPVIHKADLQIVLRKALLENGVSQKKTPAPDKLEKGGPDGTTTQNLDLNQELKKMIGGT
jgi:hypothetical protein